MREKSLPDAAAQEAFEEAGVRGRVDTRPIGHFDHIKNHLLVGPMSFTIVVFPLEVSEELADWPEREQRSRRWFARAEALAVLQSNQLRRLVSNFQAKEAIGGG